MLGVEVRSRLPIVNGNVGRQELRPIGVRQQQDRFGHVPHVRCREGGLILVNQGDDVLSMDIAMTDDGKARLVEVVVDAGNLTSRNGRSNRPDVEDVVKPNVVDITCQTGDFFVSFLAKNIPTDGTAPEKTHSTTSRLLAIVVDRTRMTLHELNAVNREGFVSALRSIFEESPWAAERAWQHRPFASLDALHQAMIAVVSASTRDEQLALLRAHPDLGSRARMTPASTGEQAGAGLDRLTPSEFERLRQLNTAYREKFGFPFLFAVKGSTKHDVLAALEARLPATPEEEFAEALRQVYRIAWFRLQDV